MDIQVIEVYLEKPFPLCTLLRILTSIYPDLRDAIPRSGSREAAGPVAVHRKGQAVGMDELVYDVDVLELWLK